MLTACGSTSSSSSSGSGSSVPTKVLTYGEILKAVNDSGVTACSGLTATGSSAHIFSLSTTGDCSPSTTAGQGLLYVEVLATPTAARDYVVSTNDGHGVYTHGWLSGNIGVVLASSQGDAADTSISGALDHTLEQVY